MTPLALPPRRREVAELLAEGCSYEEIAARLGMSRSTVKKHVGLLYAEAGVHDRALFAVRWDRMRRGPAA